VKIYSFEEIKANEINKEEIEDLEDKTRIKKILSSLRLI